MTYKEYREILRYELYRLTWQNPPLIQKIRIKFFQPNTNCMYLARKMWFFYSKGLIGKLYAKFLYLKIIKKYGCVIYPHIDVKKGFFITHPVGIVIGKCSIGENFLVNHGCTIGVRRYGEEGSGLFPKIGNNVTAYTNSMIIGDITISDNITLGAYSIAMSDLKEPGTYIGTPATLKKRR